MHRLALEIGRPVSFGLTQNNNDPDQWRRLLEMSSKAAADGAQVRPQVHGRTVSILLGFQTFHPLSFTGAWTARGLGLLSWDAQVAAINADDELREQLLRDLQAMADDPFINGFMAPEHVFVLGDPPDYEPGPSQSVAGIAAARGADVWATFVDLLLTDGGRELLNSPILNYSNGNLDATRTMLAHPTSVFGLGDGGAHAGQTCDASTTTSLLSYWARDRSQDRISIEDAVHTITGATADMYGLGDRGRLVPGLKGDVNVIDFDRLQLHRPELVADLPAGASRLIQRAEGYVATINAGQVTLDRAEDTGARPGVLLRGARGPR
jgi:N-acyl-D-aspartate/D-glutamate deacylase